MRAGSTARARVERFRAGDDGCERSSARDSLAVEEPLEIRIVRAEDYGARAAVLSERAHRISVTMRTPGADFDLTAGFLYGEGLLDGPADIREIRYCVDPSVDGPQRYNIVNVFLSAGASFDPAALQRNFYTTSSCGVCGKASIEAVRAAACPRVSGDLRIRARTVLALPARLRERQRVFERTGGLHAAALFTPDGDPVAVREDVGRHNAMDKLVGRALLAGELPLDQGIVMVSGRLSFELVQKAARAGVPVLCGVSAPSSLAVELAEDAGMTLVGFLRARRFNVYAGGERVAAGASATADAGRA